MQILVYKKIKDIACRRNSACQATSLEDIVRCCFEVTHFFRLIVGGGVGEGGSECQNFCWRDKENFYKAGRP